MVRRSRGGGDEGRGKVKRKRRGGRPERTGRGGKIGERRVKERERRR